MATSESWTDQSGQRQDRTEWHRVVIFDKKLGEIAQKYLHKGAKIYLEGQLKTRKWTDQSGNERHATEVVLQHFQGTLIMLDSPKKPGDNPQAQSLPAPKIPTRQELDDEHYHFREMVNV